MKQLAVGFILVVLASCTKQYELDPPIYDMNRMWYRIEYPNYDPVHYRFYPDGTMTQSTSEYSRDYKAVINGNQIWLSRPGAQTRHWYISVIEEDKLQVVESDNTDTFNIVCK